MKKNGLEATGYCGWIDNSIEITPVLKTLLSEYVIGSPAYGLSYKGRDLYSYYGYTTISDYDSLYDSLFAGIDFRYFEKYEELKTAILSNEVMSFTDTLPEFKQEYVFIYSGLVNDSEFYKTYFTTDSAKGKKKEQISIEAIQRKKTTAIDKLFAHIRNGLAHGHFSLVKGTEEYLVFQDQNQNHFISARAIIYVRTLYKWIDCLNHQKKSVTDTNSTTEA